MRDRLGSILRGACIILAVLVVFQFTRELFGRGPLEGFDLSNRIPPGVASLNSTNPPGKAPSLPPEVQARVEKIKESEILGMVMRPPPMAVLGIAGKDVILRAPNGQTGLIRVGEELGGVKLLRIGTNRVLIEHENQTKELTIFQGFGGETLISQGKESK